MGKFFTEYWELVVGFILLLFSIIGFLIKNGLKTADRKEVNVDARITTLEKEMKEMKENYITRFEEVMTKLNEFALTTKDSLHSISLKLDKQVTVCAMVQKAKVYDALNEQEKKLAEEE